jgi:cytochrome c5
MMTDARLELTSMRDAIRATGQSSSNRSARRVAFGAVVAIIALVAGGSSAAAGTERSGKEVVESVCISCHGTGAKGAPKIGDDKAWAKRSAQGLTSLTKNALDGIRQMPPHGGNPGLTDTEIERAITYMVNQSGGHWIEPISRTSAPQNRSGRQIVEERCATCHRTGEGGAPKIGDQAAWIPRLKQGLDIVVRSAIKGHGGMPARGGQADLTDAEIRAAIIFMMNPTAAPAKAVAAANPPSGPNYRVVDGTTVYFGAISADVIRRNRSEYPERVYGAPPMGPDQYYVTIALFDVNTGKRISDASVRARVSTANAAGPEKTLELLPLTDSSTYGNYFAMGGKGPFEVTVTFRRPGALDTSQARFEYAH